MNTIASPFRTSLPLLLNRLIPTWNVFYSYFQSNLAILHLLLPKHLSSRPLMGGNRDVSARILKERGERRTILDLHNSWRHIFLDNFIYFTFWITCSKLSSSLYFHQEIPVRFFLRRKRFVREFKKTK